MLTSKVPTAGALLEEPICMAPRSRGSGQACLLALMPGKPLSLLV